MRKQTQSSFMISTRASARSISVPEPTYFRDGNICVMQLLGEPDSSPAPSCSSRQFIFFANTPLKKSASLSLSHSKQTKSSDSLAFSCSPPALEYCPLLFFFSSSAPSLPIIYSILSDGPAKTLPEDTAHPPRLVCVSP